MLTIGAFARLGGVSVRALRHYEQVGVLLPARTDPVTGYRYYRAHQLARLHRLQALQDLGLSLHQLAPLLDDGISGEQLSGMLVLTRTQLAEQVAEHRARLARVEQRLRYIALEDDMSIDMIIKRVPAIRVAQVRYGGAEGLDFSRLRGFLEPALATLNRVLDDEGVTRDRESWIMHYVERPDGTLTPILAVPIDDQPFEGTPDVEVSVLADVEAVVTIYRGTASHDGVGPLYGQMWRYAEDHGYRPQGPGRDRVIERVGDQVVVELTLPVDEVDA
jgi:DNA-binding transcriptional MerR regulator